MLEESKHRAAYSEGLYQALCNIVSVVLFSKLKSLICHLLCYCHCVMLIHVSLSRSRMETWKMSLICLRQAQIRKSLKYYSHILTHAFNSCFISFFRHPCLRTSIRGGNPPEGIPSPAAGCKQQKGEKEGHGKQIVFTSSLQMMISSRMTVDLTSPCSSKNQ